MAILYGMGWLIWRLVYGIYWLGAMAYYKVHNARLAREDRELEALAARVEAEERVKAEQGGRKKKAPGTRVDGKFRIGHVVDIDDAIVDESKYEPVEHARF